MGGVEGRGRRGGKRDGPAHLIHDQHEFPRFSVKRGRDGSYGRAEPAGQEYGGGASTQIGGLLLRFLLFVNGLHFGWERSTIDGGVDRRLLLCGLARSRAK